MKHILILSACVLALSCGQTGSNNEAQKTTATPGPTAVNNDLAHNGLKGRVKQVKLKVYSGATKNGEEWVPSDTSEYGLTITSYDKQGFISTIEEYMHTHGKNELLSRSTYKNDGEKTTGGEISLPKDGDGGTILFNYTDERNYDIVTLDNNGKVLRKEKLEIGDNYLIKAREEIIMRPNGKQAGTARIENTYDKDNILIRNKLTAKDESGTPAGVTGDFVYTTYDKDKTGNPLKVLIVSSGMLNRSNIHEYTYEYYE